MAEPPTIEFQEEGKTWHRVWRTSAIVRGSGGVQHLGQTIPVSRSLPLDYRPGEQVIRYGQRVIERPDGTCSTLDGSRIVDSPEAMKRHCADANHTHEV